MQLKNYHEKKNRKKNIKSQLIIGSLLIFIGLGVISYKYYNIETEVKEEEKALEVFYEKQNIDEVFENSKVEDVSVDETKNVVKIEYIGSINIDVIGLERGLVPINNYMNNVNYGIEILKSSDMPDVENGNFILASHSGTGYTSYFKNVHKLDIGDKIDIHYNYEIYTYKVVNMYEVEKTGTANIVRNGNKDTLTLVTCVTGEDRQLIVIAEKEGV